MLFTMAEICSSAKQKMKSTRKTRWYSLSYIQRNKIASVCAFISGVLFILSGYQANGAVYEALQQGITIFATEEFQGPAKISAGVVAMVAHLGGIAVIAGGLLFTKNRVTSGKILVMIGAGQGIVGIVLGLTLGTISEGAGFANRYALWLISSATGVGIVCSIVAQHIAKGKGKS